MCGDHGVGWVVIITKVTLSIPTTNVRHNNNYSYCFTPLVSGDQPINISTNNIEYFVFIASATWFMLGLEKHFWIHSYVWILMYWSLLSDAFANNNITEHRGCQALNISFAISRSEFKISQNNFFLSHFFYHRHENIHYPLYNVNWNVFGESFSFQVLTIMLLINVHLGDFGI